MSECPCHVKAMYFPAGHAAGLKISSFGSLSSDVSRFRPQDIPSPETDGLVLTDLVNNANVGMVQRTGGARFAPETLHGGRGRSLPAKISVRRRGQGGCPRPCRPHPSRRPAFPRCDNAKLSGRSFPGSHSWRRMFGCACRQVNAPLPAVFKKTPTQIGSAFTRTCPALAVDTLCGNLLLSVCS